MPAPDPYEHLTRGQFEALVSRSTCDLGDADWEGIRQVVISEWEAAGVEPWVIDKLRHAEARKSPVVRRKAFELVTNGPASLGAPTNAS